jgi:hypothetical protein
MYTIYNIIKHGIGLFISIMHFCIFILVEVYVVSIADKYMLSNGIVGEFLGLSYSQILWYICFFLISMEAILFILHFIWSKIKGFFGEING